MRSGVRAVGGAGTPDRPDKGRLPCFRMRIPVFSRNTKVYTGRPISPEQRTLRPCRRAVVRRGLTRGQPMRNRYLHAASALVATCILGLAANAGADYRSCERAISLGSAKLVRL